MRAKLILVLVGACLVGVAAVHLTRESTAERTNAAATSTRSAAVATPDVQRPRAEVRLAAPSSAATALEPKPQASPEEERAQIARIEQYLGERLESERVDPAWALGAEGEIAKAIAGPAFAGLRLDSVSCRATICRLGVTASEQVTDVEGTIEELTTAQPLRAGGFMRFTTPRTVTMFVARAGHALPRMPRS